MPFTGKAIAAVWLVVFGLFALSASGIVVGKNALWLVLGAVAAPAIIFTLSPRLARSIVTTGPADVPALASKAPVPLRTGSDQR